MDEPTRDEDEISFAPIRARAIAQSLACAATSSTGYPDT